MGFKLDKPSNMESSYFSSFEAVEEEDEEEY